MYKFHVNCINLIVFGQRDDGDPTITNIPTTALTFMLSLSKNLHGKIISRLYNALHINDISMYSYTMVMMLIMNFHDQRTHSSL